MVTGAREIPQADPNHGLVIRKGNGEGTWEPRSSGWAAQSGKDGPQVPSSESALDVLLPPSEPAQGWGPRQRLQRLREAEKAWEMC